MCKYWPLLQKFFKWTDNSCRGSSSDSWCMITSHFNQNEDMHFLLSCRASIIMLFTTTCWYVCRASDITAVGEIKKNLLNASKCNDEEWEFYEKHKSMFRCKRERNMHVMHLTTQWQAWEKKIDMSLVFVFCLDLCADNDPLVLMHLV